MFTSPELLMLETALRAWIHELEARERDKPLARRKARLARFAALLNKIRRAEPGGSHVC